MSPILPGAVIGIIGGGQLGRMIAAAAARLGYRCHVFTDTADAPAAQVTSRVTVAPYDDPQALAEFAASVDVVAFEFENLPAESLERLAERVPVRPRPAVLRICQDRLEEKRFLDRMRAPTAPWHPLRGPDDVEAMNRLPQPWIVKSARFGYDGKGQRKAGPDDLAAAWAELGHKPSIVESEIAFEREISVIVARSTAGEVRSFVPVENRHENHILRETVAPAPIADSVGLEARRLAERLTTGLDVVGLLAVEMFLDRRGQLLVNELAPRPHNSGHWTIDACAVSQFEQLVRAITGLPLGDPSIFLPATMTNLLGKEVQDLDPILREPGARLHLYGKDEVRAGRKLGHVTRLRSQRS